MNLEEIKNSLDRLNRYFEFMNSSPDKISSLDRDSFLQQLRDIYDLVLHEQPTSSKKELQAAVVEKTPPKEEKKTTKKAPKLIFNQQESNKKEEPPATTEQTSEKKEEPKAEVKEAPVKKEPVVQDPPKEEEKPVVKEATTEKPVVKKEPTPPDTTDQHEAPSGKEDYEELFIFKEATDLAAKLSESPIANLNQSLGLNEKFHYINELFAGDVATFKTAIDFFNEAGNMEKARNYAEAHLIEQFGWMKKEKKNLAKDFIKFIRRRYL